MTRLVQAGAFPAFRLGPPPRGRVRIRQDEFEAWLYADEDDAPRGRGRIRLVPEQPVDARLSLLYQRALASGDYVRRATVVVCRGCSGLGCQLCESEPAPPPGRLSRRLRARLTRKER